MLRIKACTVVLFTFLIITAVTVAGTRVNATEPMVLAHPERVGIGQPFLVRLTSDQAFDRILIHWMDQEFAPSVSQWNGHHVAIAMLGTDVLTIKPGRQKFIVRAWAGGKETVLHRSVKIIGRTYPRQELSLPSKMVTPPTVELERIKAERARTQKAKKTWSDQRLWRLPFHRPVEGSFTSVYGLQRVLNGTPKNPHQGVDFRAPVGTAVEAVAEGRVILVESHYYAGNSIYIDHGNGVISLYFHLSDFDVSPGDIVKRGQVIGRAGSTGRATGPHLHLSISVQGQLVDPVPLFEKTSDQLLR
ncbi:M23 family metallopeptidase [uncultured Desulfobacter sp.]|uniref:M23 family metallopeptidase n=1 Tax=uncultured Desulfobacter sp. TaxID=240139 RepID=UPI002AA927E9|nr:M23 family metallopeptidase [uncultured Desulfobacter sp.]